jgi:hypothetical protein
VRKMHHRNVASFRYYYYVKRFRLPLLAYTNAKIRRINEISRNGHSNHDSRVRNLNKCFYSRLRNMLKLYRSRGHM